jgi:hypothetical protein
MSETNSPQQQPDLPPTPIEPTYDYEDPEPRQPSASQTATLLPTRRHRLHWPTGSTDSVTTPDQHTGRRNRSAPAIAAALGVCVALAITLGSVNHPKHARELAPKASTNCTQPPKAIRRKDVGATRVPARRRRTQHYVLSRQRDNSPGNKTIQVAARPRGEPHVSSTYTPEPQTQGGPFSP